MKIGIIHATINAIEPMMNIFAQNESEVTVINFTNENLLVRANEVGGADYVGLRAFTRLVFEAIEAKVDGIIVACSVFCPYVPLMQNFTETPMIAIDNPMLEKAIEIGGKIGIIATTAPSAPTSKKQLVEIAEKENKVVDFDTEVVTEAMVALKKGNVEEHNKIVKEAGKRLIERGCTSLLLCQITMACAGEGMKDLGIPVLTSPQEGMKKIMTMIRQ